MHKRHKAISDSARRAKKANDSLNNGQKDIGNVLTGGIFYPFFGKPDSIARQKDKLYKSVLPNIGYSPTTGLIGTVSAAASFYMDNPDLVTLSSISFSVNYTQKNQLYFPVKTDIWSKKNKYAFPGEICYYKFTQYTYGLGGHSSLNDADKLGYQYLLLREAVLKKMLPGFYLGGGYALDYHWQIKELVPPAGVDDFELYGFTQKSTSSGITINALFDTRHNPINPTKGFYANIVYRGNFSIMGSDENWQSLIIDIRKYCKLRKNSNNVLAFWSYNWIVINGTPPYLDLPSTGWDTYNNQGRGYRQDRFKGNNLLSVEAEYRFYLTHTGLFGAVIFVNAQTVSEWPGTGFNAILPAAGTGIRIKLNKHSAINIAIDFGYGSGGSMGIFAHSGEAF